MVLFNIIVLLVYCIFILKYNWQQSTAALYRYIYVFTKYLYMVIWYRYTILITFWMGIIFLFIYACTF